MNDLNELLAQIPVDQVAARLGVDPQTARVAVQQVLPALLGGMKANAADPAGAASLAGAVAQHDPSLVEGGIDLEQVDAKDGERIVGHVFGEQHQQVVDQLGATGPASVTQDLVAKLLPVLAPIVMAYLAKRLLGDKAGNAGALAGVLGSLLATQLGGAASASTARTSDGLDLGGILGSLGGLLGGGRR